MTFIKYVLLQVELVAPYASLGVERTNNDDDDCNKTLLFRLLIRYHLIQSDLFTTVTLGKWQNDCYAG